MRFTVLKILMIQLALNSYTMPLTKNQQKFVILLVDVSKIRDPEKYCLNYNDPTFCKTVGDIRDAGGFVKPEDAYCKGVTD